MAILNLSNIQKIFEKSGNNLKSVLDLKTLKDRNIVDKKIVQLKILGTGEIKKSIMIGDSETDSETAKNAGVPFILLEDGYTEKKVSEISHDHLIRDFVGIEKIVSNYLND